MAVIHTTSLEQPLFKPGSTGDSDRRGRRQTRRGTWRKPPARAFS